ncbi:MAG: glutamate--cysteine ligase [Proteobacteria bacterium]|nr:glutamate--cysteine ligase [Pseudomonadota bacterium]
MSAPPTSRGEVLENKRQLVEYFASGAKPKADWRIGTEHEKFLFRQDDLRPLPYEGDKASVRGMLEGLERFGWSRVEENGKPVALLRDGCSVTLEPGGQFELSGAPLENIHQTCDETNKHLAECKTVGEELGVGLLGVGFVPKGTRAEMHWMPKGRTDIMRRYMPTKGNLGLDMMARTCTVQVNLDFASEADMVRKFRVSLALQPIATAMFASSPFVEGKPNGFLSYRSHTWTDTDPDRCGMPAFVFEDGMGYERYADYMLGVPMYFAYRDGRYTDLAGKSFGDFMAGKFKDQVGDFARTGDWADHVTTAFPEVRLKKYIEMRGADGGPWKHLCALPALWVGLLYDSTALDAAAEIVKDWTVPEMLALRRDVPRMALHTSFRKGTVLDVARQVVDVARKGLNARARMNRMGDSNESHFLEPLAEIVASGKTRAERMLDRYNGAWNGTVDPLYREYQY